MGSRYEVEVTVGSGQDLKNVNWRNGDLKPYVVLWVDDGPKCSTGVDHHDGENPEWRDEKLVVWVPPSTARLEDAVLHVDVVHANAAAGTKPLVGSARLPLRDVVDDVGVGGKKASRTLRLTRPSGRPQGRVDVRVTVREAARHHDPSPYPAPAGSGSRDPYHAAAAPPPPAYYGQQPPQAAPPVGYPAYAPSAPAYAAAAPPVVVAAAAPQKGNHSGMGMGTGLAVGAAAGMLGGLALAGGASYLGERFDDGCCSDDDDDYY